MLNCQECVNYRLTVSWKGTHAHWRTGQCCCLVECLVMWSGPSSGTLSGHIVRTGYLSATIMIIILHCQKKLQKIQIRSYRFIINFSSVECWYYCHPVTKRCILDIGRKECVNTPSYKLFITLSQGPCNKSYVHEALFIEKVLDSTVMNQLYGHFGGCSFWCCLIVMNYTERSF